MAATPPRHYFVRLLGTRPEWPENMTPEEQAVMGDHFAYLRGLIARKKVLMAGPVFEPFGLVILQVASEEEARGILDAEPSVAAGVHRYEITEMRVSLLAHHVPADRFAQPATDRLLEKEVMVEGSRARVWKAWTTSDGLKSFFSDANRVELRIGGPFEIYFSKDPPPGQRGSEDCKILSFLPERMLSFEWNAPPQLGAMRDKRTHVVLTFEQVGQWRTRVTLSQLGWGEGEAWNGVYEYFDKAWGHVLEALRKRFAEGPRLRE